MTLAGPSSNKSSAVVLYSLAAVGVMSIVKQLYRSASAAAGKNMPKKIALVVAGSGVYDGACFAREAERREEGDVG